MGSMEGAQGNYRIRKGKKHVGMEHGGRGEKKHVGMEYGGRGEEWERCRGYGGGESKRDE